MRATHRSPPAVSLAESRSSPASAPQLTVLALHLETSGSYELVPDPTGPAPPNAPAAAGTTSSASR